MIHIQQLTCESEWLLDKLLF